MNEKARTIVFNISALLLLAGAGLYLALPVAAPYLFAVGAAGIFASALMFSGRKEWMICLTISALLQLYTAFVTPKKEN